MSKRLGLIDNAFVWAIKQGQVPQIGNEAKKLKEG